METLSDKRFIDSNGAEYSEEDVKEFIRDVKDEDKDFEEDIIALIEINNYGKKDLITKMRRLCKAHQKEKNKLAGDILT